MTMIRMAWIWRTRVANVGRDPGWAIAAVMWIERETHRTAAERSGAPPRSDQLRCVTTGRAGVGSAFDQANVAGAGTFVDSSGLNSTR